VMRQVVGEEERAILSAPWTHDQASYARSPLSRAVDSIRYRPWRSSPAERVDVSRVFTSPAPELLVGRAVVPGNPTS